MNTNLTVAQFADKITSHEKANRDKFREQIKEIAKQDRVSYSDRMKNHIRYKMHTCNTVDGQEFVLEYGLALSRLGYKVYVNTQEQNTLTYIKEKVCIGLLRISEICSWVTIAWPTSD